MSRFPTAGHLVSWAKLSPRTIQSGARNRSGKCSFEFVSFVSTPNVSVKPQTVKELTCFENDSVVNGISSSSRHER